MWPNRFCWEKCLPNFAMGTVAHSGLEAALLGRGLEDLNPAPDMDAATVAEAATEPTRYGAICSQGVVQAGEPRHVVAAVMAAATDKAKVEAMVEVTAMGVGGLRNRPSVSKTCKMKSIDRLGTMQLFHTTTRGRGPVLERSA